LIIFHLSLGQGFTGEIGPSIAQEMEENFEMGALKGPKIIDEEPDLFGGYRETENTMTQLKDIEG
jgi:hypothetical protein